MSRKIFFGSVSVSRANQAAVDSRGRCNIRRRIKTGGVAYGPAWASRAVMERESRTVEALEAGRITERYRSRLTRAVAQSSAFFDCVGESLRPLAGDLRPR